MFRTMVARYPWTRGRISSSRNGFRFFVLKTKCAYNFVNDWDIDGSLPDVGRQGNGDYGQVKSIFHFPFTFTPLPFNVCGAAPCILLWLNWSQHIFSPGVYAAFKAVFINSPESALFRIFLPLFQYLVKRGH